MKKVSSWGIHSRKQDWRTDNRIPVLHACHSGSVSHRERRARIFGGRALEDGILGVGSTALAGVARGMDRKVIVLVSGIHPRPSPTMRIGSQ